MTIQELVNQLSELDDKDRPVFIYTNEDIYEFEIDDSITDRLDINIIGEYRIKYLTKTDKRNK